MNEPTIFERITDVQAASDRVTRAKTAIKEHPQDYSLRVELQIAQRELAAATTGTRASIKLINAESHA